MVAGVAAGLGALSVGATGALAQTLIEVCPDSPEGTGAVWGLVADSEAEMGLPGATVAATWTVDGEEGRMEGQTALDGGYTLCYVPLGVELALRPAVGGLPGAAVAATLSEAITRIDMEFSLTSIAPEDERLLGCVGPADGEANQMLARLLRCDAGWQPLESCPREADYGTVSAPLATMPGGGGRRVGTMVVAVPAGTDLSSLVGQSINRIGRGGGSASLGMFREPLREMLSEARERGANALVNLRVEDGELRGRAVTITADPATCA